MANVVGTLLDLSRQPIRDTVVRVYGVGNAGAPPVTLGEGRTDSSGNFAVVDVPSIDRLLRVAVVVGSEVRFVLEVIHEVVPGTAMLGTILVASSPLFELPGRAIYGLHEGVLAGVERVVGQRGSRGVETTVGMFLEGTAKSLADVRAVLREGGLDVGPLKLEMKALVPAPGMLKLIGPGDLAQLEGGQLSTITLQVEPSARPATAAPPTAVVPDVVGYTETLAQRKLQQEGFAVRVAREVVAEPGAGSAGPSFVGRVVRLDPPRGTSLRAGSIVTLYIGERAG